MSTSDTNGSARPFEIGDRVVLLGLSNAADLNGHRGVVGGTPDSKTGRLRIFLDLAATDDRAQGGGAAAIIADKRQVNVKPSNLEREATRSMIHPRHPAASATWADAPSLAGSGRQAFPPRSRAEREMSQVLPPPLNGGDGAIFGTIVSFLRATDLCRAAPCRAWRDAVRTRVCVLAGPDVTDEAVVEAVARADGNLLALSVLDAPRVTVGAFSGLGANADLEYLDISGCRGLLPADPEAVAEYERNYRNNPSAASESRIYEKSWKAFHANLPISVKGVSSKRHIHVLRIANVVPPQRAYYFMGPAKFEFGLIDVGMVPCQGEDCQFRMAKDYGNHPYPGPMPCMPSMCSGSILEPLCAGVYDADCAKVCISCKCRGSTAYAYKGLECRFCGAFFCGRSPQYCAKLDPRMVVFEDPSVTKEKGEISADESDDENINDEERGRDWWKIKCRFCSLWKACSPEQRKELTQQLQKKGRIPLITPRNDFLRVR